MTQSYYHHQTPIFLDTLPGGHHWCQRINKGTLLKLTALASNANVALYVVNADEKLERYNMPDSLKAQHTLFLSTGHVLYSDLGRVLASVVADDHGWNDTITAPSSIKDIVKQYGTCRFEDARNDMHQSGKEGLSIEMAKFSLKPNDLTATLNLFSKVVSDLDGNLSYVPADNTNQSIDIRFEMNCLVFLSAAPHLLDPATQYDPADIKLALYHSNPLAKNDICRDSCEQNKRGFENNAKYFGVTP